MKLPQNFWPRLLYFLWLYTLLVILWGAWVRISHSGDGCGDHWPLCSGEFIPEFTQRKTWVEYAHRLMSGLYGLVVLFVFMVFRQHGSTLLRGLNWLLLVFMLSEAGLGAALVKGRLVTVDDSVLRLFVMSLHQINSFMLTGITFLFYLSLKRNYTSLKFSHKTLMGLFLLLPLTGAIAALSSTLFPSISVWQGILQDFETHSHLFIRLRILHPALALTLVCGFVAWCYRKDYNFLALVFLAGLAVGIVTLLTLSPFYLKLAHLLIAHLLWAALLYTFVNLPDSSKR